MGAVVAQGLTSRDEVAGSVAWDLLLLFSFYLHLFCGLRCRHRLSLLTCFDHSRLSQVAGGRKTEDTRQESRNKITTREQERELWTQIL